MASDPRRSTVEVCPICDGQSRREFLRTVGGSIAAAAAFPALGALAADEPGKKTAETWVKTLYDGLKDEQRKIMCFPFNHPLRYKISNNWHIVDEKVGSIETLYTSDQKEVIRQIFRGVTSEEGYEKFQKQMQDDAGGFEKYTCAIFGRPGEAQFEWVLTGRHLTIRADGNSVENSAFGGPIFYGHAVTFDEKPDHPGNVWWHQSRLANQLYKALDGKQQKRSLLKEDPADAPSAIELRGPKAEIPGLSAGEMSGDQRDLLEKTIRSLLNMYRQSDVEEAIACLKAQGGIEKLHLAFYQAGDLGDDGIWDRWKVEGPAFAWYFRGSPHVHTWVNIASRQPNRVASV